MDQQEAVPQPVPVPATPPSIPLAQNSAPSGPPPPPPGPPPPPSFESKVPTPTMSPMKKEQPGTLVPFILLIDNPYQPKLHPKHLRTQWTNSETN